MACPQDFMSAPLNTFLGWGLCAGYHVVGTPSELIGHGSLRPLINLRLPGISITGGTHGGADMI